MENWWKEKTFQTLNFIWNGLKFVVKVIFLICFVLHICCCFSVTKLCPALCDPMDCSTGAFHILHYLLEFVQTQVHWVSDAIQTFQLLLPLSPFVFNLPQLSFHIKEPIYWSFSFSISPSNEYSGLISLMVDWFDLLAVRGTLKSPLQHHSLKESILWHLGFSMV